MLAQGFEDSLKPDPISMKLEKADNWTGIFIRPTSCGLDDEKGRIIF